MKPPRIESTRSFVRSFRVALAAVLGTSLSLAQGINDAAFVSWKASADRNGNSEWESVDETYSWMLGGDQGIRVGLTNLGGVRAWYAAPKATAVALDSLGFSTADVSLEIVFRPGSYEDDFVLLESGGNLDGTAFVIQQGVLEYRVQDANSDDQRVILTFDLPDGGENDFYHAVATVMPGAGDDNEVVLLCQWGGSGAGLSERRPARLVGQQWCRAGSVERSHLDGTVGIRRLSRGGGRSFTSTTSSWKPPISRPRSTN